MLNQFQKGEMIADYPAWTIYRAAPRKSWALGIDRPIFRDSDIIGLPWDSRRYGTMHHWYRFGSVASFALKSDDCPIRSVNRAKEHGHKLYWLNPEPTVLTNDRRPKEERVALEWGDEVVFEGRLFRIEKAPNQNAELVEVEI